MPEWFYSSLAQSCASIAGFIGGFLFLRLLQLTSEWKGLLDRLRARHRDWMWLDIRVQRMDDETTDLGPYKGEHAMAHEQLARSWADLYDVIREKRQARISWEMYAAALLLLALLAVGTFAPLLELDEPDQATQMQWVLGSSIIILGLFVVLGRATWIAQRAIAKFQLGEKVDARLEDYELQIEAWEEQDHEARRKQQHGPQD